MLAHQDRKRHHPQGRKQQDQINVDHPIIPFRFATREKLHCEPHGDCYTAEHDGLGARYLQPKDSRLSHLQSPIRFQNKPEHGQKYKLDLRDKVRYDSVTTLVIILIEQCEKPHRVFLHEVAPVGVRAKEQNAWHYNCPQRNKCVTSASGMHVSVSHYSTQLQENSHEHRNKQSRRDRDVNLVDHHVQ
jgi:hypothetical protein